MKAGYFARLAVTGIKNNRRFYLPYFLTCAGMMMMEYIVTSLPDSAAMAHMPGASTLRSLLTFGSFVILFFSALFLFYTHSFLMRRRKKEFGLYNVLGMDKFGIGRILAWETLLVGGASFAAGIAGGAIFAKMAELLVTRIMRSEVAYELTFSLWAVLFTAVGFGVIFLLIFLWSVLQVRSASAISLLRSENAGEKPPRANWVMGLLGVVVLGAAYFIAAVTENPLQALLGFFIAVLMVIAATYALMISGSVLFCRVLQRNKRYYYQSRHFVSVSSMAYRMKRNGAGLASICILSTMVLVMMIASVSLYAGMQKSIGERYPRENCVYARLRVDQVGQNPDTRFFFDAVDNFLDEEGAEPENTLIYRTFYTFGRLDFDTFDLCYSADGTTREASIDGLCSVSVVPLSDLNRHFGTNYALQPGEALIACRDMRYDYPVFRFGDIAQYRIAGKIAEDWPAFADVVQIVPDTITLFVPDFDESLAPVAQFIMETKYLSASHFQAYCFDGYVEPEQYSPLANVLQSMRSEHEDVMYGFKVESRTRNHADYLSFYGGLLFLGILLSVVFLSATVLIIYYKQVTEGFEDQARFGIMQNVGMTKKDIRMSINSQMLTVFFLPLALAVMHTAFAIPLLTRMLRILGMITLRLILVTGGVSVLVFALFYVIVYRITAHAYFGIVSEAKA